MGGIGTNGTRLKVEFLQGNAIIHSPECFDQGQHPLTPTEAREFVIGQEALGGVVRLQSVQQKEGWPEATLSQEFASNMFDKLQDLLNAAYGCTRRGVPQSPLNKEIIKIAQEAQDEFSAKIVKPETWDVRDTTFYTDEGPDRTDRTRTARQGRHDVVGYLGSQYYVNLRTENELRTLVRQLEGLGHHFDEVARSVRALRPLTDVGR